MKWHKWLLAGIIAFIATVAYTHRDVVSQCLLYAPVCHRTEIFKSQERMNEYNEDSTSTGKDEHR